MKQRPILFSTDMVNAIIEGRKTQTRRVCSVQPKHPDSQFATLIESTSRYDTKHYGSHFWLHMNVRSDYFKNPYGNIGDQLWVRETWQETTWLHPSDENYGYIYKASENGNAWEGTEEWKWKPSIFMPREACRLYLDITNVRVERLQDISEEDAKAEGIQPYESITPKKGGFLFHNYETPGRLNPLPPIPSFETLWQSINGKSIGKRWKDNPWVWVVEFRVNQQLSDLMPVHTSPVASNQKQV